MLQKEEKESSNSCLNKAAPDEPVFVLRGQDLTAPYTIRDWIDRNPQLPAEKQAEAEACIEQMMQWRLRKMPD